MIETEKVLHLRRCVTLLQTGLRSSIARSTLHTYGTAGSPRGGYVFRCVPQRSVQAHLRPENYVATYSRMFSTIVTQSTIDDVDQRLMLLCNDAKKGHVSADDLEEVLKLCEQQPRESTSILLLKCCGNLSLNLRASDRQKLIDQAWNLTKRNSKVMTLDHYNTLLQVQSENCSTINPMQFLADMTVEPDENTYCLLLNIAAKTGNSKYLWDIMSTIKEKNILFDESTFNSLVQLYANNGNITEAEHAITLMRDANLPVAQAYNELACGYAKLGDIPNLIKILNDEPQSDTNLLKITKVLGSSENNRHIPVVLNLLTAPLWKNESEISKLITELIRTDRIAAALVIINYFMLNDATKDIGKNFVYSFLNELVISKVSVSDITTYATDMMNLGEPLALSNVAEIALKLGREELCYAIFDAMKNKGMELRPHYYWPLLMMAHYNEGETKIFSIIKSMCDMGVDFDIDTLLNYVYPYINTALVRNTMQRILMTDIPSSVSYTALLSFLLSRNRLEEAINLRTVLYKKISYKDLIKPLVHTYLHTRDTQNCIKFLMMEPQGKSFVSLFLKMLLNDQVEVYVSDVQLLLMEFAKYNAKIPRRDANFLINRAEARFDTSKSIVDLIKNLADEQLEEMTHSITFNSRYMNTKDLECLLVELKSKNMYVGKVLYKLLDAYCYENKLEKAEKIRNELNACNYRWTNGMKIILAELYLKNNKLIEASALLSEIDASGTFKIDNTKIIMFAIAYVKANKPRKAFDIIEQITNVNERNNVQRYCYDLLDTLARSEYHDQTMSMLKLLLRKKYCIINSEVLRPLVAISLERNDIPRAMETFRTCVREYKKTPLALELLTALMQQRNSIASADLYINEVYKLILDGQGIEMANTKLIIALATLNQTQELETMLREQVFSTSGLFHYASYAQRHDETDILLRIFDAMPDRHNINRGLMCDLLIAIYSKTADYNGALDLWNKMRAKNVEHGEQFEKSFTQLLLLNKVPLPPELQHHGSEKNSNAR